LPEKDRREAFEKGVVKQVEDVKYLLIEE